MPLKRQDVTSSAAGDGTLSACGEDLSINAICATHCAPGSPSDPSGQTPFYLPRALDKFSAQEDRMTIGHSPMDPYANGRGRWTSAKAFLRPSSTTRQRKPVLRLHRDRRAVPPRRLCSPQGRVLRPAFCRQRRVGRTPGPRAARGSCYGSHPGTTRTV